MATKYFTEYQGRYTTRLTDINIADVDNNEGKNAWETITHGGDIIADVQGLRGESEMSFIPYHALQDGQVTKLISEGDKPDPYLCTVEPEPGPEPEPETAYMTVSLYEPDTPEATLKNVTYLDDGVETTGDIHITSTEPSVIEVVLTDGSQTFLVDDMVVADFTITGDATGDDDTNTITVTGDCTLVVGRR